MVNFNCEEERDGDGDGTEGGVLYRFSIIRNRKLMNVLLKEESKRKLFDNVEVFTLHFSLFLLLCTSSSTSEVAVAYLESKVNEAMTQRVIAVIYSHKGCRRA